MPIRKILGIVLIGASYWVLRGRVASMSFEVKVGNSWGGVLSDVEYLIPLFGAFLALAGGTAAALGRGGRIAATIGTALVFAFTGLLFAMSGMMEMVQPFLAPVIVMLLMTTGLWVTKAE